MAERSEQTVLIVEDDAAIADLVDLYLRGAGLRVLQAASGGRGLQIISERSIDLAILDIGLPDTDGFEVCRQIRQRSSLPVLFLSARDEEMDRVNGFELGADDYVTKPFSPRELVARVKAILRRGSPASADADTYHLGEGLRLDTARREVTGPDGAIALATREFDLVAFLAQHQGRALTRAQLIEGVWGVDFDGDDRTVDVHVAQVRKKLGPDLPLATVWGVGYRLG